MNRLIPITTKEDILLEYRNTPIGQLLEYHNLACPFGTYSKAELLIGMCMDNRKHLHIPENFAFILRTGGANLKHSEFKISFAISVGDVRFIALIGHNQCGMVNLSSRKEQFIEGLVNKAGWDRKQAVEHFDQFVPMFEIGDEIGFVLSETRRLRLRYPKITIAPLLYRIDDNLLYMLDETQSF